MSLLKRLGYYLGGFSVGLILLAFFLGGKRASCDYSPNARVLKSIRTKSHLYSEDLQRAIQSKEIDSNTISYILQKGNVDFKKSNTKLDSCRIYVIEETIDNKEIALSIENCDSIARITFLK